MKFGKNDYLIMGPDYTVNPQYSEYDYGTAKENYDTYWKNYGWYDYDDLFADRYYYQNWNESDAFRVPVVISLKSYGGSGWTEKTYWDMYAGSSDYLWAYVMNFGQKSPDEPNYQRFYYGQNECTLKFAVDDPANDLIVALLTDCVDTAQKELDATEVAKDSSEVSEDRYWVTVQQKAALEMSLEENRNIRGSNKDVYSAYLGLKKAVENFRNAKKTGTKMGYTWFSAAEYEQTQTYTIRTKNQLAELAQLVNGTADFGGSMEISYDFTGKTILLSDDIDLEQYRIVIGDESHPFKGTFDGQNHTLSNLNVNRSEGYTALFGNNAGTVKNITVSGKVTAYGGTETTEKEISPVGGISAYNSGKIENCRNEVQVSAPFSTDVGGIAGRNEGTILNCLNAASVTGLQDAGGIAGYTYAASSQKESDDEVQERMESPVMIQSCLNAGNITALYSGENANAGGITGGAGAVEEVYPVIENCINSGNIVTALKTAGGIIGSAWIGELTIRNCYSIGSVSSDGVSDNTDEEAIASEYNIGSIAGRAKASIDKCYWVSAADKPEKTGVGYTSQPEKITDVTAVLPEELTKVSDLGDGFRTVVNGYPVLKWQKTYQVGFETQGENQIDAQTAGEYLKAYQPEVPVSEGKTFEGWFTTEEHESIYNFDTLITGNTMIFGKIQSKSAPSGGGASSEGSTENIQKPDIFIPEVGGSASLSSNGTELTIRPDSGYEIAGVTVNGVPKGNVAELKGLKTGDKVIITFKERPVQSAESKFEDVTSEAWYYDAVAYVAANSLFNGVSETQFAPDSTMTRAMFVTVLGRLEGIDTSKYPSGSFSDVPSGQITLEQMAVIMYRYAQFRGIDVSAANSSRFESFTDKDSVSSYAKEAMIWATANGVINGTDVGLEPQKNASRAQVAQIVMNYSEKMSAALPSE